MAETTSKSADAKKDDTKAPATAKAADAKVADDKATTAKAESKPAQEKKGSEVIAKEEDVANSPFITDDVSAPVLKTDDEGNQIVTKIVDGEVVEKVDNKSARPRQSLYETFDTTGNAGIRVS